MNARVEPEWAMVTIIFVDIRGFTTFARLRCARAGRSLRPCP
jgi:class 3 adenylate cyclase